MTEKATVVEIRKNIAVVEAVRSSACEGCHKKDGEGGCSVCSLLGGSRTIRAEAFNRAGAKVGDSVIVESSGSRMLFYAALIFIFPIVAALAAYFAAAAKADSEKICSLIAVAVFILCCAVCILYSSYISSRRCDVVITEIMTSHDDKEENK